MPRNLNEGCKKYHTDTKNNTDNLVQEAINKLREEGAIITGAALAEITGLAQSTFYTKHVEAVLKKNKVCKFKDRVVIAAEKNNEQLIEELSKKLEKTNKLVTKLTQEMEKQKQKYFKLQADHIQENEDYQLLLGKWHTLIKKAKIAGINIVE